MWGKAIDKMSDGKKAKTVKKANAAPLSKEAVLAMNTILHHHLCAPARSSTGEADAGADDTGAAADVGNGVEGEEDDDTREKEDDTREAGEMPSVPHSKCLFEPDKAVNLLSIAVSARSRRRGSRPALITSPSPTSPSRRRTCSLG